MSKKTKKVKVETFDTINDDEYKYLKDKLMNEIVK